MSSTFSIALSALKAESQAINATGNNLANMNTTGFKGSQVDFKDLFSEYLGTGGGSQYGLGVNVPITNAQYSQGSIASSSSPLAAAIDGNGFFVVNNSSTGQQLYTRDGNFVQDSDGVLKTETGEAVQGWTANAGVINTSGVPGNIVLPVGSLLPASPTQNFSLDVNLDSSATVGASSGSFSQPMPVVDSLGNTHNLTVTFTKTASNTWSYAVTIPGADVGAPTPQPVATSGSLNFNTDGTLIITAGTPPAAIPPVAVNITGLADGASDMSINWNLLSSSGSGTLTQYAEASAESSSTQDGKEAAQLTTVAIQTGGQVVATYSDGRTQVAAQLALAAIANPDSLQNVGNNNLAVSASTATPAVGVAGTGGRGTIDGSALEGSNVDMATEFTNLIVYQSGYQAASRVISTENTISQDLLNLIH